MFTLLWNTPVSRSTVHLCGLHCMAAGNSPTPLVGQVGHGRRYHQRRTANKKEPNQNWLRPVFDGNEFLTGLKRTFS